MSSIKQMVQEQANKLKTSTGIEWPAELDPNEGWTEAVESTTARILQDQSTNFRPIKPSASAVGGWSGYSVKVLSSEGDEQEYRLYTQTQYFPQEDSYLGEAVAERKVVWPGTPDRWESAGRTVESLVRSVFGEHVRETGYLPACHRDVPELTILVVSTIAMAPWSAWSERIDRLSAR